MNWKKKSPQIIASIIVITLLISLGSWIVLDQYKKGNNFLSLLMKQKHDGLYISNIDFMGISATAWVIKGDKLMIQTMGSGSSSDCKQYGDRIELSDGRIYRFNEKGDILLHQNTESIISDLRMVKISNRTDLAVDEIVKILTTSYEKKKN